jgi:hypothetical protein
MLRLSVVKTVPRHQSFREFPLTERTSSGAHPRPANLPPHEAGLAKKIGAGVKHFTVEKSKGGTQCFYITRIDGSHLDFSVENCLRA